MKFRSGSWDRSLYLAVLGIYLALFLSALSFGVTSWDEETDYLGIRTQVAHAIQFLRGQNPDYRLIHSNLEYYGTAGLLPAWLIWFFQNSLLVGRLTLRQALYEPSAEHQLTGFFATSHFLLGVEFIALSLFVVWISKHLGNRFPWLSGLILILTPSLVGHSFVNPKDIPFALFYTAYTYFSLRRARSSDPKWYGLSLLFAGLLINQKFVALLPVLLTEVILFVVQPRSLRCYRNLFVPAGALLFALLLQPAAWGLLPWLYLHDAFETFAVHEWGGCMWWGDVCIGVRSDGWSAFIYLWKWWSVKLPLVYVFLILVQLVSASRDLAGSHSSIIRPCLWWIVIAQAFLIPLLAVMANSNFYDADRHTLFVYPPLAVFACAGFQSICDLRESRMLKSLLVFVCFSLSVSMAIDTILLNPYQIAYINESGRFFHDHQTTSLDYWSVSAKESIRQAQLNGSLSLNPTVDDSLGTLPLFIGLRQLAGHVSAGASPALKFQVRDAPSFVDLEGCNKASEVSRTLLTGQSLVMSRLWTCP